MATDARQEELNQIRMRKQDAMYAAIMALASEPGQEKLRVAMKNTEKFYTKQLLGCELSTVLLFLPTETKNGSSFGYAASSPRRRRVGVGRCTDVQQERHRQRAAQARHRHDQGVAH
jgi:hypothetical protein